MPRMRTSFARGFVAVVAEPVVVVAVPAVLLVEWLVLVAVGFQGPFSVMVNALALPPVGTSIDATLATSIFGLQGGLIGIIAFVVVRAVLLSFLTAFVVDALEVGTITRASAVRAVRALPTSLAVNLAGIALLTLTSLLGPLLGPGLGVLIQVGGLVAGVYLFAAAPVIAVAEARRMPDAMSRSVRAARMPGSSNLTLAVLYVIPAVAIVVAPGKPGSLIGVNPTPGAWALAIVVNLLHVAMLATFAFRYLSVATEVPDAPVRSRPASRSRR
jgi:hypothetical protein